MTDVIQANPMLRLYGRLSKVGYTRKFIREAGVLPAWWKDDAARSPGAFAQAKLTLATHLGVELESLSDASAEVRLRRPADCRFKRSNCYNEEQLLVAAAIGDRTARLAAAAMSVAVKPVPSAGLEIRQQILDGGAGSVGLAELLDYCWSLGIPVVQVSRFPPKIVKMDGLAARVRGRPVIILSRNEPSSARMLFILAHELGHIARGHLSENGVLVDEGIEPDGRDDEEREANAFAIELIAGAADRRFLPADLGFERWPNAERLAAAALETGRRERIDPGHIVLNYAHSMSGSRNFWPVAMSALRRIDRGGSAQELVRSKMHDNLDWSGLPEDSCTFLMCVAGGESTT
jgi:hypothetical protein